MRSPTIQASVIATVAAIALAACSNQNGMMPSGPSEAAPPAATNPAGEAAPTTAKSPEDANATDSPDAADAADQAATGGDSASPLVLKTCATSPPQYQWIFKGACQIFTLQPSGGNFSLGEYQGITVKGLIGKNTLKSSAKIALADAVYKNGDIKLFNGKAFPKYKANGITYVYAAAVNQSNQVIKPITVRGKPVLQYVITNVKGFGTANTCSAAVLTFPSGKPPKWTALPATGQVKGKSVTINQYTAPKGFELPPKIPLYFGVNCYKQ
jgi:hypothetical protein